MATIIEAIKQAELKRTFERMSQEYACNLWAGGIPRPDRVYMTSQMRERIQELDDLLHPEQCNKKWKEALDNGYAVGISRRFKPDN